MLSFFKKYKWFLLIVIVLSAIILTLFYSALKPKKMLPIYNPSMVNPELVDSTVQYISKYHSIADFSFTNQNGKIITQKVLDLEAPSIAAASSSSREIPRMNRVKTNTPKGRKKPMFAKIRPV